MRKDLQNSALFIIRIYQDLYKKGIISGAAVERHNELIKQYTKKRKTIPSKFPDGRQVIKLQPLKIYD
tara:strand:- start:349 stop:552 length:204 start_codon:yes stop_codon:yes gene_type:complete